MKTRLLDVYKRQGLYRAMAKNEILKARLAISSEMIDCNQLINSFSLSEDSASVAVTDTAVSYTHLFVFFISCFCLWFEKQK